MNHTQNNEGIRTRKMKALYIIEPGRVEVKQLQKPRVSKGEVLLRVGMVGFCGSDLSAFRGKSPLQQYPNILGHEIGATIEDVGPDVPREFKPGMKVTVSPYQSCGRCIACSRGRPNACRQNKTMGVHRPGAMTEYITASYRDIFVSQKLSLKELALVEPLTVGFHAVQRGRVGPQDKVVVLGCGIVGLAAVSASADSGAQVTAVDIVQKKLKTALKAGAAHTINSAKENLHTSLEKITAQFGPDVVIEAVGLPQTFRAAVQEVAFTGRVVYIGYTKEPVEYETKIFVQKELDILGSRNSLRNFPKVITVLEEGKFPTDDVLTSVVSLNNAADALSEWDKNPADVTKIMVDMQA